MEKDLTTGNIFQRILIFAFPIFIGNVFQQLYNMADSIIVGRFVGKDAFAAVGSTGSLNFLIIGFVLGLSSGLCIPVAQRYGANKLSDMRRKIAAAVQISIVLGIGLTIVIACSTGALLRLMQTPDSIYKDAYTYIFIIFLGIPATLLYNVPANISRALGDSKIPLYFLLVSAFMNVILDLIFVCIFHMGVSGTAIATVISQALSGILCIIYLKKKYDILTFQKEEWEIDLHSIRQSTIIGIPMGLQFSITAIGSVVLQSAVNLLGADAVVAVNAAMKILMIFTQPFEALGATLATYSGQNLGAGKIDRIQNGVKISMIFSVVCSIVLMILINLVCLPMSLLFMKQSDMTPYITECIQKLLFFNSCTFFPLASLLIFRNTLQGLGHSVIAMGAGLFEMLARTIVAFLSSAFGYTAICFANPAAWIAANIILVPLYISTIKKLKRQNFS